VQPRWTRRRRLVFRPIRPPWRSSWRRRALLWVRDATDARRVAAELVAGLGGELVSASSADGTSLAVDLSFGDGEPQLPAAPPDSSSRQLLERYLPGFVADAARALEFAGRTDRLVEDASIDVLTGLPNRRMVGRALGRLAEGDIVIMIDLDHFKLVNDRYGHAAGDEVLRVFGRVLRACTRGRDVVGRYGGEEFVVVLGGSGAAEPFIELLQSPSELRFEQLRGQCLRNARHCQNGGQQGPH
jgi:GGDEF domain-containing protein